MRYALFACILALAGCCSRSQHVDLDGVFMSEGGAVAIGSFEVQSAPEGVETAMVSYEDSKAWFADMKEHRIRVLLTGTNSVQSADGIIKNICKAFVASVPVIKPVKEETSNEKKDSDM